jgi:hypothetical protein
MAKLRGDELVLWEEENCANCYFNRGMEDDACPIIAAHITEPGNPVLDFLIPETGKCNFRYERQPNLFEAQYRGQPRAR